MQVPSRAAAIDREATNRQHGSTMQIRVVRQDHTRIVLLLKGELDITSMDSFERVLTQVPSERAIGITFDLAECTYVSVHGYEVMAHMSRQRDVEVRVTTDLACKVLALCGYEGMVRKVLPVSTLSGRR
jgi:anti-anti-sigma factor